MPLIAASTCSQTPASRQIGDQLGVGSNAIDDVVPWRRADEERHEPGGPVGGDRRGQRVGPHGERARRGRTVRSRSVPMPAMRRPFSMLEWACDVA